MSCQFIWGTMTVVFDLIGWVLIKHSWSLSFKEFYIDYKPLFVVENGLGAVDELVAVY